MLTNISGFPEFLPRDQIAFNRVMNLIRGVFESYGFSPLDTPAVEKLSTLLSKGNDHEIYGVYRLSGEGEAAKKDLALRFDLTVPLARYVSQHYGYLTFPYRRYHIAPVWRGERAQAGRYRQFYQCDVDIIGEGELSLAHDAEVLSIIHRVFTRIGIERFVMKINNRKVLTGILKSFELSDETIPAVMRTIDKVDKISADVFNSELLAQGLAKKHIAIIQALLTQKLSNTEWLTYLSNLEQNDELAEGIDELKMVLEHLVPYGVEDCHVQIDPSLARGLTYYTGTVCETKLLDFPELGSVCGGGRYANLAGAFTNKKLPGVGISIGISRLIPKLIELGLVKSDVDTPAVIMVTTQNKDFLTRYIEIANHLRVHDIPTELYLADKQLGAQIKYADKRGIRYVIIADVQEFNQNAVMVKDLKTGEQTQVSIMDVANWVKKTITD